MDNMKCQVCGHGDLDLAAGKAGFKCNYCGYETNLISLERFRDEAGEGCTFKNQCTSFSKECNSSACQKCLIFWNLSTEVLSKEVIRLENELHYVEGFKGAALEDYEVVADILIRLGHTYISELIKIESGGKPSSFYEVFSHYYDEIGEATNTQFAETSD